ncbi:G-patch domain containing protein [Parasponia andersonii]|uniref:G-patch domain containing protein n=1 Tax=Parasponia andersonii TaxID=3476 RepID=A0A2P5BTW0_PARAD|nr:G-patch domain containing protein [Parasponia andersonii]
MAELAQNRSASGEEDDDYMGDLSHFLPPDPEASNPPKPSSKKASSNATLFVQSSKKKKKKKAKTLNWQEQRKLERERKQEEEDEQTLARIDAPIPQSNVGFKLLKQMGYTPGSALGKEGSGRAEPVGLEIRRSRAGIGREDPRKEKRKREEMKDLHDILMKLREEHRYCLFCGFQYESMEALLSNCPGTDEDDH